MKIIAVGHKLMYHIRINKHANCRFYILDGLMVLLILI